MQIWGAKERVSRGEGLGRESARVRGWGESVDKGKPMRENSRKDDLVKEYRW